MRYGISLNVEKLTTASQKEQKGKENLLPYPSNEINVCIENATVEMKPPTENALLQHTRRAVYYVSI